MAKINISMDDALLDRVDKLASESYVSRSGLIAMAMSDYVNSKEIVSAIKSMSVSMAKIASTGTIDEETKKELEAFEKVCAMLAGN